MSDLSPDAQAAMEGALEQANVLAINRPCGRDERNAILFRAGMVYGSADLERAICGEESALAELRHARKRITELERVYGSVNHLLARIRDARPFSLMHQEYQADVERLAREGLKALASVESPTPQEAKTHEYEFSERAQELLAEQPREDDEPGRNGIPDSYWREVPCGHPPDPVALRTLDGVPFCHCGRRLDESRACPRNLNPDAPGPIVPCETCGCFVAVLPAGQPQEDDEPAIEVGQRWEHHSTGVYTIKRVYEDQGRERVTIRRVGDDKLSEAWGDDFRKNFRPAAALPIEEEAKITIGLLAARGELNALQIDVDTMLFALSSGMAIGGQMGVATLRPIVENLAKLLPKITAALDSESVERPVEGEARELRDLLTAEDARWLIANLPTFYADDHKRVRAAEVTAVLRKVASAVPVEREHEVTEAEVARAAAAMSPWSDQWSCSWDQCSEPFKDQWRTEARRVLAAARGTSTDQPYVPSGRVFPADGQATAAKQRRAEDEQSAREGDMTAKVGLNPPDRATDQPDRRKGERRPPCKRCWGTGKMNCGDPRYAYSVQRCSECGGSGEASPPVESEPAATDQGRDENG